MFELVVKSSSCESIVPPLLKIFGISLAAGTFPNIWNIANVVPVHEKQEESLVKNYRSIALFPNIVIGKCIYDNIYSILKQMVYFPLPQSYLRKTDSCISQLLVITLIIFQCFDAGPSQETRGIFLYISKAFDRGYEGLLFFVQTDFLSDRF